MLFYNVAMLNVLQGDIISQFPLPVLNWAFKDLCLLNACGKM